MKSHFILFLVIFFVISHWSFAQGLSNTEKEAIKRLLTFEVETFLTYHDLLTTKPEYKNIRSGLSGEEINHFEDSLIKLVILSSWYKDYKSKTVMTKTQLDSGEQITGIWELYSHFFEKLPQNYFDQKTHHDKTGTPYFFNYEWVRITISDPSKIAIERIERQLSESSNDYAAVAIFPLRFEGKKKNSDIIKYDITSKRLQLFFNYDNGILSNVSYGNIYGPGFIQKPTKVKN